MKIERAGAFEFALRRWPAEAGHRLRAGIDGEDVTFLPEAIAKSQWRMYLGGEALPITSARLEIEGRDQGEVAVSEDDTAARFSLYLGPGQTRLRAWFVGSDGLKQSPYYVEVRRLGLEADGR